MSLSLGMGLVIAQQASAPILGPELFANVGFDADTDWIKGTGWSISGGEASCDGTQPSSTNISQTVAISSKTYRVSWDVTAWTSGSIRAQSGTCVGAFVGLVGSYEQDILSSTGDIGIQALSTYVGSIDNLSVREVL